MKVHFYFINTPMKSRLDYDPRLNLNALWPTMSCSIDHN